MTWRPRVKVLARFRGVPFELESVELTGGRRTVTHEYPMKDLPFVEDLGRRARTFPVEGFVVGDDYMEQRDALRAALEDEGPGELVHPYYGTLRVVPSGFTIRESARDGGKATFAITFNETPAEPTFPTAKIDAAAKVKAAGLNARAAAGTEFLAKCKTEGEPAWATLSLSGMLKTATAAVDKALAPVVAETQRLAAMKHDLDALALDANALVRKPFEVVGKLVAVFESLDDAPMVPGLALDALLGAAGFTTDPAPAPVTATRAREAANHAAFDQYLRRMMIIQAAILAPDQTFDSFDEALEARDEITDALDEQIETAGDDAFPALDQLRTDLIGAVPAAGLARLVTITPAATLPSLVLAHRLYGDLSLEADLIARNGIEAPGFVRGGVPLEVLSRGD